MSNKENMEAQKPISKEKNLDYICFVLKDKIKTDSVHLKSIFSGHGLTDLEKSEHEIINKRRLEQ